MGYRKTASALSLCGFLLLASSLVAQRTLLEPAWNLFTPQQDVELGQDIAADAESRLRWSQDMFALDYVDRLGQDLAANAVGYTYPYDFRIFTDSSVQSIALPGGTIYVSSGLVLASETEHQLAGILAHQMGHVIARHGSQQISAAYAKRPNVRLSSVSIPRVVSELNLKADPGTIVLKHNTEAEQEADRIAVQLLYDAGFDPAALVTSMQRLSSQPASATRQFFADHPAPPNRATTVRREMQRLGPLTARFDADVSDLRTTQANLRAEARSPGNPPDRRSERPSTRFGIYEGYDFDIAYPDNWSVSPTGSTVTIAPENGIVSGALAYGMLIDTFVPRRDGGPVRNSFTTPGQVAARSTNISTATDQLIEELRRTNPNLRVIRTRLTRIAELEGLEVELRNDSPVGGAEVGRLLSVLRPNDVVSYFLAVAPQSEINPYQTTFDRMFLSIRFYN